MNRRDAQVNDSTGQETKERLQPTRQVSIAGMQLPLSVFICVDLWQKNSFRATDQHG